MVNVRANGRIGVLVAGLGSGAVFASIPGTASADSSDWLSSVDSLLSGLSVPADTAPSLLDIQISIDGTDLFSTTDNERPPPRRARGTSRLPSATAPPLTSTGAAATSPSPKAATPLRRPAGRPRTPATTTPPTSTTPQAPQAASPTPAPTAPPRVITISLPS